MVYLVDDDHDDLEMVQEALFHHSYKGPVLQIDNGKKLVDKLYSDGLFPEPRVIVLDLNMPLIDGFQALQSIRSHAVYHSTPVIILTASTNKADETRSYELGCNFFLNKPSRMSGYEILTKLVKKFV
jgi:DNA-binding response OmpR family regulator